MGAELSLIGALLLGFLGSSHCAAMCGGISSALGVAVPAERRQSFVEKLGYVIAYNAGRILSYVAAGALAGSLGILVLEAVGMDRAHALAGILSGLVFIALGLYLTGWWRGLAVLERAGQRLWRRIEPLGRRLLPVDSPVKAVAAGMVWGWLPCGLVYSALLVAMTAGDAVTAMLQMLAFGLGTLPMVASFGLAGSALDSIRQHPGARLTAGIAMLGFGVALAAGWIDYAPMHHHHH